MVTVMTADREKVILREVRNPPPLVGPNWYTPMHGKLSNVRYAAYTRKAVPDPEKLKQQLAADPDIHIYTIVSHSPILSETDERAIAAGQRRSQLEDRQRVRIDDEGYIDEFGFYVYVVARLGYQEDEDRRYDSVPEPELFMIEHEEYDVRDRQPHRMEAGL